MRMVSVPCRGDRSYCFSPARTALLVIDMQKEFFEDGEGGEAMRAIVPRVASIIALARGLGLRVVHTRESYQPDFSDVSAFRRSLGYVGKPGPLGRFCIIGEPGHEFVEAVRPLAGEIVIDKASFGAFYNTDLDRLLRSNGIDNIVICGITTQCCVHSTLREAVDRGYWCLTVADGCAASEPGLHDAALALIAGEGHLFGWVADTRDFENGIFSFDNAR